MNDFITYIIKSGISLILLYGIYWMFMRKELYFTMNRLFLLGAMTLSFLMPLVRFSFSMDEVNTTYYVLLDTISITSEKVTQTGMLSLSSFQIFLLIYLTGVAIFTFRMIYGLIQIGLIIRKYGITKTGGENFVFVGNKLAPFSFFNIIFINKDIYRNSDYKKIIDHERIHIRQVHTLDIIIAELLIIFQWFNPVIWLYRKSLKEIHEYLADEGVIIRNPGRVKYQMLLLQEIFGVSLNDLTNNFNQSILKRRFTMMSKTKSKKSVGLKLLLTLPLTLAVLFLFTMNSSVLSQENSADEVPAAEKLISKEYQEDAQLNGELPPPPKTENGSGKENVIPYSQDSPSKAQKEEDKIFTVVKHMPEYPGGRDAMYKFIQNNLVYPQEAKDNGTTGRVFVTFVIEKDGSVADVKLLRGIGSGCDAEAMRVIESMSKWKPGRLEDNKTVRVQYNLPIKFSLNTEKKE